MIVFFGLAALIAALCGLLILSGAQARGREDAPDDAALARGELTALDALAARGQLTPEAHALARAEAGRRLLRDHAPTALVVSPRDRLWVAGSILIVTLAGLILYLAVTGAPGREDEPYQRRVDEWAGSLETLEPAQIAAVLQRVTRERPDDPRPLTLLGAARFEAGDPLGAASAFRRALTLTPEDAQSWARLGESLVQSQDGVIGGDAEAAFREAIRLDPDQLGARYFLGRAALDRGDGTEARAMWEPLIAVLAPSDPRRPELVQGLAAAGVSPEATP